MTTTTAEGPGLKDFIATVHAHGSSAPKKSSSSEMSAPATWNNDDGDVDPATAAAMRSHNIRSGDGDGDGDGDGGGGGGGSVASETGSAGSFFIETYGCQMNVSDSEVVRAILLEAGFREASSLDEAGVVLANTCAIRERAEGKVWDRLKFFSSIR